MPSQSSSALPYVHEKDGNRTQRKEFRGPSGATAAHEVVTWSFDPITGRQTGVTTFTAGSTTSTAGDHSTSTTYTHDILGRLSSSLASTKVGAAYPTLSSVTYRYDAYGNLKEQRTSDGITARRIYGYDHSGISVNLQPFGETAEEKFHHISAWERDKLVRLDYIRISATDYALLVEGGSDEDATSPISAVANTPNELLWRQDIDYTPTGQNRTVGETSATATGFIAHDLFPNSNLVTTNPHQRPAFLNPNFHLLAYVTCCTYESLSFQSTA